MCFNNHSLTFFQINKHEKDVNFSHYDILCDFNAALCVIHGQTYKFIQFLINVSVFVVVFLIIIFMMMMMTE